MANFLGHRFSFRCVRAYQGLTYTNDSIQYMSFSPVRVFPDWLMFHDFVFVHLTLILTNKICHSILESCTLKMSILFMCLTPLFLPLFV